MRASRYGSYLDLFGRAVGKMVLACLGSKYELLGELSAKWTQSSHSVRRLYPILSLTAPRSPPFAAQISFGSLNRNVTKQKLDLLQFASCRGAKPSTGPGRSCGANLSIPAFAAYSRITCQTAFSVSFSPQAFPILSTRRNTLPAVMFRSLEPLIENMLHPCGASRLCGYAPPFPPDRQSPNAPRAAEYGRDPAPLPHG